MRTSDGSLKEHISSIYIYEWAKREDWRSVGAVARWVVLLSRWYTTVGDGRYGMNRGIAVLNISRQYSFFL